LRPRWSRCGSRVDGQEDAFVTAAKITLIGGPTALVEVGGFRLLTDPTFDAPGEYKLPHVTLKKTSHPALTAEQTGRVDAVLLSHDQHADNFDHAGRAYAMQAPRLLTTIVGAKRLGGVAEGLAPGESTKLTNPAGTLTVTATPARHGPAGIEPLAGDVIGFVLPLAGGRPIYITGDTVWYEGVAEVARRFQAGLVLLFAGAAKTRGGVPSHHGRQRRARHRARLSRCHHRSSPLRRVGAFQSERRRSRAIVQGARHRRAAAVARARRADGD
jgi:L-ascorbate metabolism protein UlaG (beta-lactamase superfamily)